MYTYKNNDGARWQALKDWGHIEVTYRLWSPCYPQSNCRVDNITKLTWGVYIRILHPAREVKLSNGDSTTPKMPAGTTSTQQVYLFDKCYPNIEKNAFGGRQYPRPCWYHCNFPRTEVRWVFVQSRGISRVPAFIFRRDILAMTVLRMIQRDADTPPSRR